MKRVFLLAGLCVLGLYGCGSKPSPVPQSGVAPTAGDFAPKDPRLKPLSTTPDIDKPGETTVPPSGNGATTPSSSASTAVTMTPEKVADVKKELSSKGQKAGIQSAAEGWVPSTTSPMDLAKKTDQAMGWLKGAMAKVSVAYEQPSGHGSSLCKVAIKDGTKFNIEYPALTETKYHELTKESVIADGKSIGWFAVGKGVYKEGPLSEAKYPDTAPLADWPYKFPKLVFSTVRGGHPFQALIQSATKPGSGMKVTLQERSFDYKGKIVRQKLVIIQKQHVGGALLTIEVIIDADRLLPVSVVTAIGSGDKKLTQVQWTAGWGFPSPDILDRESYEIPRAKTSATPTSS